MVDFEFIYNSVKLAEPAPQRALFQIRHVLAKAYELAQYPIFNDTQIFDLGESSSVDIHRTTVERMLHELDTLPLLDGILYTIGSQSIEMSIDHLNTIALTLNKLQGVSDDHYSKHELSGYLRAHLRYFINTARDGVISTYQTDVLQRLSRIPSNAKKVVFLKQLLLSYKQREANYDKQQFAELCKFIKLEKKKWALGIDDSTPHFTTTVELLGFVSNLITTELEHYIRRQGGYKNFWKDDQYTLDKKEVEVQQYIRTVLEPWCKQKSVTIHRESFAADGSVDMTFTYLDLRVCLEIKKAQHQDVDKAMSRQLVTYMQAERTDAGIYLVLWYKSVGGISLPTRYATPQILAEYLKNHPVVGYHIDAHVIDCTKPVSPSKQ